jgi:hypothetical protein
VNQRRKDIDIRAHNDDVARLERWVIVEQVEDRVAHDFGLADTAVTGVHLQASIVRLQQHALSLAPGRGRPAGARSALRRRKSCKSSLNRVSLPHTPVARDRAPKDLR